MPSRKKISLIILIIIVAAGAWLTWYFLGNSTFFKEDSKILYIKTGSSFSRVNKQLNNGGFVKHTRTFYKMAKWMGYNNSTIQPGRYVIKKGSSIYSIIQLLKSGKQTPVTLVMGKLRTKEDLINKLSSNFECDSAIIARFILSNDSLKQYGVDTNTVMCTVIPSSYAILWNASFQTIFNTLYAARQQYWTDDRKQKAAGIGLSQNEVYTLASIVEEETNKEADKGKIASVYLNRLNTGMKLGADPTIKFAMKNFDLRRIYQKHLFVQSPYNTYLYAGLPPGPICTASTSTMDAVLNAPATNYLFFVAKPSFDGYSNFAATYEEHLQYAKAYQLALDTLMKRKAEEGK